MADKPMFSTDPSAVPAIDNIAHLIQVALTPIFFLTGIASLLNVFASRLARVSDRCHRVTDAIRGATAVQRADLDRQLRSLTRRSFALDVAVLLGTLAGGATCAAAMLLFVGSLRDATITSMLYLSFGLALLFTIGALIAFAIEMLMASRGLRDRRDHAVHDADRLQEALGPE